MIFNSPLEQFIVDPLYYIDFYNMFFSITNFSIFAMIMMLSLWFFLFIFMDNNKMNNKYYFIIKNILFFFETMTMDTMGAKKGPQYFSMVLTIFIYIALMNIIGLIPFVKPFTSHLIVTMFLSFSLFITMTMGGLMEHKEKWFALFIHKGLPYPMILFLSLLEVLSYLVSPMSLGVRLFCNIIAGHLLMKIFSGFFFVFMQSSMKWLIMPQILLFIAISLLFLLELLMACLQAYIFTLLVCMYINDAINIY